jgi:hypothetical protein
MAYTAISDVIDPEILADMLSAKFPDHLVLGNSNLVEVDGTFPLGSPGSKFKMPFWKKIGAFAALTEGTAMTPGKLQSGAEYAVVQRAGAAFEVLDTAELVSKADPVSEISSQISRRAAEYIDGRLVVAANNTPNKLDISMVGSGKVDQNAIIQAMLTLGDNRGKLLAGGAIIMHSKQVSDLLQTGAIQNNYQSGMDVLKTGMFSTVLGLPIIESDLVPIGASGDATPVPTYTSFIVGPGALALFYQRKVMVEYDRDILLQADVVAATVHFAAHLYGYDEQTSAVVAQSNKSVHCVALTTK